MKSTLMVVVLLCLSVSVFAELDGMELEYTIERSELDYDTGLCNVTCLNQTFENQTSNGTWINVTNTICETTNCSTNITRNMIEEHWVQREFNVTPPNTTYEKVNITDIWQKAKAKAKAMFDKKENETKANAEPLAVKEAPVANQNPDLTVAIVIGAIVLLIVLLIVWRLSSNKKKREKELYKSPEERAKELLDAGHPDDYVEKAYLKMKEEEANAQKKN